MYYVPLNYEINFLSSCFPYYLGSKQIIITVHILKLNFFVALWENPFISQTHKYKTKDNPIAETNQQGKVKWGFPYPYQNEWKMIVEAKKSPTRLLGHPTNSTSYW